MKFKSSKTINQRIERVTANHLVVGIDVAKETHVAGAVNFRGVQLGRTVSFTNNQAGYEKLMRWVHDTQKRHGLTQVVFGAESTGHYFFCLADWLHHLGEEVVLVNPLTTKRNKENRDNKPSKSDAKDAITIADAVSRGYYNPWVNHEVVYRKLRCVVNEREVLSADRTAIGNRLQMVLDQVFPEFTAVFPEWHGQRALATLKAFPLPGDLKGLTAEQVVKGWRENGMQRAGGSRGLQLAARLLATVRSSVGLTDIASEMKCQIERLVHRYEALSKDIETIDREVECLVREVPDSALKPLHELGLAPLFVAVILANAGDLSNYEHGRQLMALAGLSLCESTSGKRRGQVILSKRGRRQLRKYLYLAVLGLVSYHQAFKQWHTHNVNTLKMKKQRSIFKLIGKLTRILVGLAHNGEAFNPDRAAALQPRAA